MKKSLIFIGLLLFSVYGCKEDQAKNSTSKKNQSSVLNISDNDYTLEYNAGVPPKYYLNDNTLMNGTYRILNNGVLSEEINLKKGLQNGVQSYFKDSKVIKEIAYKNGIRDGESKGYFNDGNIKSVAFYKNDSLTGKSITYDQQGRIESESLTVDGLYSSKVFKEGKLIGEEYDLKHDLGILSVLKTFDENGKVTNILGFNSKESSNPILYILNENHVIMDSVDPKKNPKKAMELFQKIGPEFMK